MQFMYIVADDFFRKECYKRFFLLKVYFNNKRIDLCKNIHEHLILSERIYFCQNFQKYTKTGLKILNYLPRCRNYQKNCFSPTKIESYYSTFERISETSILNLHVSFI